MSETSNEPQTVAESLRRLAEENRERAESDDPESSPEFLRGAATAYEDAASYVEGHPSLVTGEVDEAAMRLRQHLGDGEIGGEEFSLSMNADNGAIFVEFDEERVLFHISDLPPAAYNLVFGGTPSEEVTDGRA